MVTVAEEVRIAIRPKLVLALIIALVMGFPINPVAPTMRMFCGMSSRATTLPTDCQEKIRSIEKEEARSSERSAVARWNSRKLLPRVD